MKHSKFLNPVNFLHKYLQRILLLFLLLNGDLFYGQEKQYDIRTIAFYNVENLFDTINDPHKFDDDRTPKGKDRYTSQIYWDKIAKLSKVISEIGYEKTHMKPVLIGLCEIENKTVLIDLIASDKLKNADYGIIHYDSPDERGIDVALLYRKNYFQPKSHQAHELFIYDTDGKRDYTRDQLAVTGMLDNEPIHIIVNHWPSRRGGEAITRPLRMAAAKLTMKIIDSIREIDAIGKIITMGDFNDDPDSPSIQRIAKAKSQKNEVEPFFGLFNPMAKMHKHGLNTLAYRDNLNIFDQIIITQPFLEDDYESYRLYKAGIYNKDYLIIQKGPMKGYPFRSYHYNTYQGGYSDHYPVYIYLIREKK
ncbi:MAG: endonuclease/exonuclease/phosphatase family protein [Flavobacteriaceae bacterium]|nr:endonuclease/exonuclease/phosphatase family protein [Flavobacteriaceae bacterium]